MTVITLMTFNKFNFVDFMRENYFIVILCHPTKLYYIPAQHNVFCSLSAKLEDPHNRLKSLQNT